MKAAFLIVGLSVALAGCEHLIRSTPAGCEPQMKVGVGSITVGGLEIPTGSSGPIKIGNATYTPLQVQRLTDTAQRMEQYRLGQCGVLSTLERLKPQPVEKITQIAEVIARLNFEMQRLAKEVPVSRDPESQVRDHEAAANTAIPKSDPPPPKGAAAGQTSPPTTPLETISALEQRIKLHFDGALAQLRQLVSPKDDLGRSARPTDLPPGVHTLVVTGFGTGSEVLTTRMKSHLLYDLQTTIESAPAGYTFFIDVIGYADISGNPSRNIEIGLKRANSVAAFIAEQSALKRAQLRHVSSGGAVQIQSTELKRSTLELTA
jgi:outer membrane protein OmpA-like peptidoglycan-associated protein